MVLQHAHRGSPTTTKKNQIYAKQKLNCLLFDPQPPVTSTADKDEDEDWLGIQEAKAIKVFFWGGGILFVLCVRGKEDWLGIH